MHSAWAELRSMFASRGYTGRGNSFQVLAELYQHRDLHRVCLSHFPISHETAEQSVLLAAQLALQLYKFQPGLTTLHAVTGAHAVSDLLPRLPPAARTVSAKLYWVWLSTLFVEKGAPPVSKWSEDGDAQCAHTWSDVRQLALNPMKHTREATGGLGDQEPQTHCIKMVYTCDMMYRKKSHPLYVTVASFVALAGRPW
jgi:hypothetical protein